MTEFNSFFNSSQTCGGVPLWSFSLFFSQPLEVWFELVFAAFVRSAAAQRYEYISAKSVWINEHWSEGGKSQEKRKEERTRWQNEGELKEMIRALNGESVALMSDQGMRQTYSTA